MTDKIKVQLISEDSGVAIIGTPDGKKLFSADESIMRRGDLVVTYQAQSRSVDSWPLRPPFYLETIEEQFIAAVGIITPVRRLLIDHGIFGVAYDPAMRCWLVLGTPKEYQDESESEN